MRAQTSPLAIGVCIGNINNYPEKQTFARGVLEKQGSQVISSVESCTSTGHKNRRCEIEDCSPSLPLLRLVAIYRQTLNQTFQNHATGHFWYLFEWYCHFGKAVTDQGISLPSSITLYDIMA